MRFVESFVSQLKEMTLCLLSHNHTALFKALWGGLSDPKSQQHESQDAVFVISSFRINFMTLLFLSGINRHSCWYWWLALFSITNSINRERDGFRGLGNIFKKTVAAFVLDIIGEEACNAESWTFLSIIRSFAFLRWLRLKRLSSFLGNVFTCWCVEKFFSNLDVQLEFQKVLWKLVNIL